MENGLEEIKKILNEILQKKPVKETMTIDEASEFSGIGKNTIIELTNKENTDFPYFKVKGKKLINRTLFIEWLNKITTEHRTI